MLGTILRLLCSAAPWTTFSSFSASLASFLSSHLTIDLSAGNPHISAAPSSVAFCAMVANLSPLGKPHAIVTWTGSSTFSSSSSTIRIFLLSASMTSARLLMPSGNTRTTSSPALSLMTWNMCFMVSLSVISIVSALWLPYMKYCCIAAPLVY